MSIEDTNTQTGDGNNAASAQLQSRANQDLGQATDKAKHDLDAVTQRAAEDVRALGEKASEKVGEATEHAKSFAADQKDLAAGQINGVAAAITKVADELGQEQPTVARYARDLASSLNNMGKTIESRDVDDLMGLAQDFGRKQPVAFLGAAALAGFVASRFALASYHRRDSKPASQSSQSSYADQYSATGPAATGQNRTGGL